tara:strand:- start:337 stop:663 length:327 start_codon:yes stop_codon:yes gene_type:complete
LKFKSLSIQESLDVIEEGALIIDVREESEYNQSHIENSILIPLSRFDINELNKNNPDNKKIIIHCRSGKRSKLAANILINQNYIGEIYEMDEGIIGWIESKLLVKSNF